MDTEFIDRGWGWLQLQYSPGCAADLKIHMYSMYCSIIQLYIYKLQARGIAILEFQMNYFVLLRKFLERYPSTWALSFSSESFTWHH